jgi:hypothetical protein
MLDRSSGVAKIAVPFGSSLKEDAPNDASPTERSGQAIVALLKEAADMSRQTCERALDTARQLSIKLQASDARVTELESENKKYQLRATEAEKWLLRIHQEVDEKFFGSTAVPAAQSPLRAVQNNTQGPD